LVKFSLEMPSDCREYCKEILRGYFFCRILYHGSCVGWTT